MTYIVTKEQRKIYKARYREKLKLMGPPTERYNKIAARNESLIRNRYCRHCERRTMPTSYYYCYEHYSKNEEVIEDFV